MSLAKKLAIVTGGSRGIGAQVARDLAEEGAAVLICYGTAASKSTVDQLIASLPSAGKHGSVLVDLASPSCGKDVVAAAKSVFGQERIDILIHSAGASGPVPLEHETVDNFDRQFAVNVRGVMLVTQAALPFLPRGGRVVMLSSIAARMGMPATSTFGGTKAVVEHFVRCWPNEWGIERGITINAVSPGPTATDTFRSMPEVIQNKLEQDMGVAQVSDISSAVLFLVSDKARWISGVVIQACNGYLKY